MKTIEERAILNLQYEKDFLGRNLSDNMVCRAYVAGATEQKAIDEAELLKLKSSWEKEAQINHDDEANYKQGYHDAIEKACVILSDLGVFDWMASDDPEGFSSGVHKDQFVKCLTEK